MKAPSIRSAAVVLALAGASFATLQLFAATQVVPPTGTIVPLFGKETKLEPPTIIDTPEAIITRFGDRARDRHAREYMFHAYDHFLPHYWINRTNQLEIIDKVAKGGTTLTYNMTSQMQLNHPNLRLFFEGKGTVAQYTDNMVSKQIDPTHYTMTVNTNTNEHRGLKMGDRVEMEFSPFLQPPVEGRTNYYGTALLYVIGKGGMTAWEGKGDKRDSYPMPETALLGGLNTSSRQYSDEPKELFKQMSINIAPTDAQPWVLGRRLQHSDFQTGMHSEPGNPVYPELVGKLGEHYVGTSCISCHTNNGRALPAAVGAPMTKYLVRVGIDAKGTPHPKLGATFQSQTKNKANPADGDVTVSGFTSINGTFADGTPFTVQKPTYKFSGPVIPEFYSIRTAPPLVGQGLLEALDETALATTSAQLKSGHMRVVSDPETGQTRMGRFGWKAGQARLKQQIAAALQNDMGVPTPIYPNVDRGAEQPAPVQSTPLPAADLENMYRYVGLLGVPPRRDLEDPIALKGEALFASAQCTRCHTPTQKTSPYHPLAELRDQVIHPYTDMMLHDMGPGLADNMGEGTASGAEWRTAPLWGIGSTAGVAGGEAYLHDGRARNLSEAILWHGGEAQPSREAFWKMASADRDALIKFLQSL